jgi:hypothetical protein
MKFFKSWQKSYRNYSIWNLEIGKGFGKSRLQNLNNVFLMGFEATLIWVWIGFDGNCWGRLLNGLAGFIYESHLTISSFCFVSWPLSQLQVTLPT